jgi:hypothetical protein
MADVQLVPTMTSNTAPSGVASAQNIYNNDSTYAAWKAFDNDVNTYWNNLAQGDGGGLPVWLKYDFGSANAKIVHSYFMNLYNYSNSWDFQGSNDNSAWTTLDSQTNQTGGDHTYNISNTTAYRYYRINFTYSNHVQGYANVKTLEMWGTDDVPPPPTFSSKPTMFNVF